jgi:hypothetical protein
MSEWVYLTNTFTNGMRPFGTHKATQVVLVAERFKDGTHDGGVARGTRDPHQF